MAKARILLVLVISILLLSAAMPRFVLAASPHPNQPTNKSPDNLTVDISLTPTLASSAFSDPDAGSIQAASQWHISSISGDYSAPLFDNGVNDTSNPLTIEVPEGVLTYGTIYYWQVRHQDDTGWWSDWSTETSFTTIGEGNPHQPSNISPANGATDIALTPTLEASDFSTLNDVGTHAASRWQIITGSGDFSSPLFDSNISSALTTMGVLEGVLTYDSVYKWRVEYQDSYGNWSAWSTGTSFTTIKNLPPNAPSNTDPVDKASGVSLTPILGASAFSDLNAGDTHVASRWQVRTDTGTYDSPVYDSDNVTTNLTSISVPSGELSSGKTYYWHVQYQDNHGKVSGWSAETLFTTRALSVPAAAFEASPTDVVAGNDIVFTDSSTGDIDSWTWNFGDDTTVTWSAATRPPDGAVLHPYTDGGNYTVSLTVTNAAGNDVETKTGYVTVHAVPKAVFSSLANDQVVQFTDSSTGEITSWKWNFGDGAAEEWTARPAGGKISHTYDKAGTYVVSLEVTGPLGTHTANKPVEVSGGGGGFHFGWWMVGVILAALLVIGGVVFLVMKRRK
jgi:PKD repeat protein